MIREIRAINEENSAIEKAKVYKESHIEEYAPVNYQFIDGFESVELNGQIWMIRDLNTDTFANGEPIPEVRDRELWPYLESAAWCYYDNDPNFGRKYGKIYNWYAVGDPRCLCPKGWRVATIDDWENLIDFYGGMYAASFHLRSDTGWTDNAKIYPSGFNALPGGYRPTYFESGNTGNDFDGLTGGVWWTSSSSKMILDLYIENKTAWCMDIGTDRTFRSNNPWYVGQYVRCVKEGQDIK